MTWVKKGDVVICIDDNDHRFDGISNGTQYIIKESLASIIYIRIINDYGHERNYYRKFFKTLVEHREETLSKLL
jgi:hypothetical protein